MASHRLLDPEDRISTGTRVRFFAPSATVAYAPSPAGRLVQPYWDIVGGGVLLGGWVAVWVRLMCAWGPKDLSPLRLLAFRSLFWNGARGSPEYSWASSATSRISACCSRSRFWLPETGEPSRARR